MGKIEIASVEDVVDDVVESQDDGYIDMTQIRRLVEQSLIIDIAVKRYGYKKLYKEVCQITDELDNDAIAIMFRIKHNHPNSSMVDIYKQVSKRITPSLWKRILIWLGLTKDNNASTP